MVLGEIRRVPSTAIRDSTTTAFRCGVPGSFGDWAGKVGQLARERVRVELNNKIVALSGYCKIISQNSSLMRTHLFLKEHKHPSICEGLD